MTSENIAIAVTTALATFIIGLFALVIYDIMR